MRKDKVNTGNKHLGVGWQIMRQALILVMMLSVILAAVVLGGCVSGGDGDEYRGASASNSEEGYVLDTETNADNFNGKEDKHERFGKIGEGTSIREIIVDQETGVEYLYISEGYKSGPCITVLYNTDGTIRINPEWAAEHAAQIPDNDMSLDNEEFPVGE